MSKLVPGRPSLANAGTKDQATNLVSVHLNVLKQSWLYTEGERLLVSPNFIGGQAVSASVGSRR